MHVSLISLLVSVLFFTYCVCESCEEYGFTDSLKCSTCTKVAQFTRDEGMKMLS